MGKPMPFELKIEFDTLDPAIAYLKSDVSTELKRMQAVETDAAADYATGSTQWLDKSLRCVAMKKSAVSRQRRCPMNLFVSLPSLLLWTHKRMQEMLHP